MSTLDKTVDHETKHALIPQNGKLDPILGRLDLIAILTAVLGVCSLSVVVLVLAVIELVKLISTAWADSFDRWLMIALAVSIVWVVVRWKRLCVF